MTCSYEDAMAAAGFNFLVEQDTKNDQRFRVLVSGMESVKIDASGQYSIYQIIGLLEEAKRSALTLSKSLADETAAIKWIRGLGKDATTFRQYKARRRTGPHSNPTECYGYSVTFKQRDKAAAFKLMFGQAKVSKAA